MNLQHTGYLNSVYSVNKAEPSLQRTRRPGERARRPAHTVRLQQVQRVSAPDRDTKPTITNNPRHGYRYTSTSVQPPGDAQVKMRQLKEKQQISKRRLPRQRTHTEYKTYLASMHLGHWPFPVGNAYARHVAVTGAGIPTNQGSDMAPQETCAEGRRLAWIRNRNPSPGVLTTTGKSSVRHAQETMSTKSAFAL